MRTIAHLYDSYDAATRVAHALEAAGFSHDDVSLVANQDGAVAPDATAATGDAVTGAATGAAVGTILGGGAGLLAGIGAMAIPGVGPVIAAGWLVATITGAGAAAGLGGLVGALTGSGLPETHAHVYAEGLRRGCTLVTIRTDEARAAEVEALMQDHHPVDVADRTALYQADEWTGFDETRSTLTAEELQAERIRAVTSTGI